MGTTVTITIVSDSKQQVQEALQAGWDEMDRLISIFDRHQNGTAISELNREGRLQNPAPEMLDVMSRVQDIYRISNGAFDPTVLPLLLLVEERFQMKGVPPTVQEMKAAEALVDFGSIQVGPRRIALKSKEQKISLDGLAKGYIVDCTGKAIKGAGVKNALINAGGDILAIGRSHRGTPWRVAIQDPFRADKYLRVLSMTDQAVATSGSYEIFYDREQNFHHLMDPIHGGPAKGLVLIDLPVENGRHGRCHVHGGFCRSEAAQFLRCRWYDCSQKRKAIPDRRF